MSTGADHSESFREAACNGDIESLSNLLQLYSVDVNTSHKINGWTALHWACKRNIKSVVEFLLQKGANKDILTSKGEKPADLTTSEEIYSLLGGEGTRINILDSEQPTFTPNYLANPVFPYTQPVVPSTGSSTVKGSAAGTVATNGQPVDNSIQVNRNNHQTMQGSMENELVLKIRTAYINDPDFIEVEMEKSNLTYEALKSVMCKELGIERRLVNKIRKLPNTILRKDKDIQRLCDFQELEVVLTNKIPPTGTANRGITTPIKNQEVLY